MVRFFGMMPSSEIQVEKHYIDSKNNKIIIQAGEHGWSVLYADHSSEYDDVNDTVDANFKKALLTAEKSAGSLKKFGAYNKTPHIEK